jgi:hypothetical protein
MLKLRTKIEAGILFFIAILLVITSVFASTRTITDVTDTILQKTTLGTGGIYDLTNAGIQEAIWACNNLSSVVKLSADDGAEIQISSTIIMGEKISLDLNGAVLKPDSGVDCIRMQDGAKVYGGTIDLSNYVENDSVHSAILFDGDDTFNYEDTTVYNIKIQGGATHLLTRGIGIYIKSNGEWNDLEYTMWLKFNSITLNYLYYGIRILSENGTDSYHHFNNGHSYSNIHISGCQYSIYINGNANNSNGLTGNTFSNIKIEQGKYSQCFIFVNGTFNIFTNMHLYDWNNSGWQDGKVMFIFGNRSEQNYIQWNSLYVDYLGTKWYLDRSDTKRNTVISGYTGYMLGINRINPRDQALMLCYNPVSTDQDLSIFQGQATTIAPNFVYIYSNESTKYLNLGHSYSAGAKGVQSVISNTANMRLRVDASGDQYTTGKNVSLYAQYGITIGARSTSTGSESTQNTGNVYIPLLRLGTNSSKPDMPNPQVGMMRFQTNNNTLAVYTGTKWCYYQPINP